MASSEDINRSSSVPIDSDALKINDAASLVISQTAITSDGSTHVVSERIDAFDFYSCEEAIKRLNDYLDSELDPAERDDVIKHLKICEPCLERFHFEKSLIAAMKERVCRSVAPFKLKERLASLMKNGS
jgi:anti-sigma factor (TIGR02949 family)